MTKQTARVRLSKKLRLLRNKLGLTQEQAAEKAGISLRYYQILESNNPNRSAKVEILEKLGKAFKIKLINF